MFCKNCGKEVDDRAVVCPNCGVQLAEMDSNKSSNETCTMAIVGFILSFFVSIAGLICSIIGYKKCKEENLNGKGLAIAGIIISVASMVLVVILYVIVIIGTAAMVA